MPYRLTECLPRIYSENVLKLIIIQNTINKANP